MIFLQAYTSAVVQLLSVLTLLGGLIVLGLLLTHFIMPKAKLLTWARKNGLVLMLIVALTATLGSLFLSEIAGWTPCKDCWFQRIFMYPQVVLLAVAIWMKDRKVALYIFVLSLIGILFSTDHYIDQVREALYPMSDQLDANGLPIPCDSSGVSCSETKIHFRFGYITIPMMALTAFVLNALGSFFSLEKAKKAK